MFDSIKNEDCVAFQYIDESDIDGFKKIIILCDDSNNPSLGEFLQGLSPTVFD